MTREAGLVAIRTGTLTPVAYGKAIGEVLRAKAGKERVARHGQSPSITKDGYDT